MLQPEHINVDAIAVLGGGLNQDGSLQRPSLQRTNRAIELYRYNEDIGQLIFSGGYSVDVNGQPLTEAEAMRAYARMHLLPLEKLMVETDSQETIGNLIHTKQLAEQHDYGDLRVITSRFHLPRTERIGSYVFGPDFRVEYEGVRGFASPKRKAKELAGVHLVDLFFKGIKPGDHGAALERLGKHPKYSNGSAADLVIATALSIVEDLPFIQRLRSAA